MTTHSEFQEKMDVLDLIIGILRDHEETLSGLADRFDAICNGVSDLGENLALLERSLERLDGLQVKSVVGASGLKGPLVAVSCKDWRTFKSASQGALLVTYEVLGELLFVSSVSDLFVFTYAEGLPEVKRLIGGGTGSLLEGRLEEGHFEVVSSKDDDQVRDEVLEPETVKRWLRSELGVPEAKIVEGRVLR